jgi:hypothetical protein
MLPSKHPPNFQDFRTPQPIAFVEGAGLRKTKEVRALVRYQVLQDCLCRPPSHWSVWSNP